MLQLFDYMTNTVMLLFKIILYTYTTIQKFEVSNSKLILLFSKDALN